MEQELHNLEAEARETLSSRVTRQQLEEFRIRISRPKGQFSTVMRSLGKVDKEDRPRIGQLANSIKAEIEKLFNCKKAIR
jgi:phenylalanyl-tRNA synthetase alpha chain